MSVKRLLFLVLWMVACTTTLSLGATTLPVPKISAAPMSVNLGTVKVGGVSAARSVTIKNTGQIDLVVGTLSITGTNATEFNQSAACGTILPGGSCTVGVTFSPGLPFGKKSASLLIPSNDPKKPSLTVKLSGSAPAPAIKASPAALNFGKMAAGGTPIMKTVTIGNSKTSDLVIGSVVVSGANASEFSAESHCGAVSTGGTCTIDVSFAGQDPAGKKSATLAISSNDPKKSILNLKLSGEVTAAGTASSTFNTKNLAGTWLNHLLATGDTPDKFGWLYGSMNYNSSGTLTGYSNITDSIQGTYSWDYPMANLALAANGTITAPGVPADRGIRGAMSQSKNLAVLTGSYSPGDNAGVGNDNLLLTVKKTGTFVTADLAGTWNFHTLTVGDGTGANLWAYGTFTADTAGALTYTGITRSDGDTTLPGAETFALAADGALTSTARTSLHGIMSSDKQVLVLTVNGAGAGLYDMAVAVKAGATFAQADLTGTWVWHALGTEDSANFWFYGNSAIDASGNVVFSSGKLSTGSSPIPATSGPTELSPTGLLTQASDTSFHGVMTPGKDVIFMTKNANVLVSDTPSLWVGMKR